MHPSLRSLTPFSAESGTLVIRILHRQLGVRRGVPSPPTTDCRPHLLLRRRTGVHVRHPTVGHPGLAPGSNKDIPIGSRGFGVDVVNVPSRFHVRLVFFLHVDLLRPS